MYGMQLPGSMPFIQTVPTVQTIPPASASQSSGEMSLLMSESKIHHGEIKSAVNRVTERIDDLMLKVISCSHMISYSMHHGEIIESRFIITVFYITDCLLVGYIGNITVLN